MERWQVLVAESEQENALLALDAVMRMRHEVARQEAVLVRRARNAGESWAAIAAVLGVSKQAVHQKYGRGGKWERKGKGE